jgi:hypothetical protein
MEIVKFQILTVESINFIIEKQEVDVGTVPFWTGSQHSKMAEFC